MVKGKEGKSSLFDLPYEAGCRTPTASQAFRPVGNSPSDKHFTPVFLLFYTRFGYTPRVILSQKKNLVNSLQTKKDRELSKISVFLIYYGMNCQFLFESYFSARAISAERISSSAVLGRSKRIFLLRK